MKGYTFSKEVLNSSISKDDIERKQEKVTEKKEESVIAKSDDVFSGKGVVSCWGVTLGLGMGGMIGPILFGATAGDCTSGDFTPIKSIACLRREGLLFGDDFDDRDRLLVT